jgi:membrane-associated phospholipid phosphatase
MAAFTDPTPSFAVGLISFPSFHSATAAIYAWATWRTPVVRWIGLALNLLMLIATPIHGSHYLVDVLAGLAVAVAAVAGTAWMFGRIRPARAPALAVAGSPA